MSDMWKRFEALTPDEFSDAATSVALGVVELLGRKRESYGPSNLTQFGDHGVLVRTSDKLQRLAHMHREGIDMTAVNESAEDAWRDIAGYALLVLIAHSHKEPAR